jgi:hypothetical protein
VYEKQKLDGVNGMMKTERTRYNKSTITAKIRKRENMRYSKYVPIVL